MAKSKRIDGWPIGIAIIYGGFVLLLLIFVFYSLFNSVDLVSKDYYAEDLAYQRQIDRQNRTNSLESGLSWEYSQKSQTIRLKFPAKINPRDISGKIIFFRPSDAQLDNSISINPDMNGLQIIDTSRLKKGIWRIKIFWKVVNTDYYDESIIELQSESNL